MESLSTVTLWTLLLFGLFTGILGAAAAIVWQRRTKRPQATDDGTHREETHSEETQRHEAQRYFLLNETGNVLISTSLSPEGRLPDATLELFSEALAHLACVFYAVSRTTDPDTNEPFSLYNYGALKRALEWEAAFIRVSTGEPPPATKVARTIRPLTFGLQAEKRVDVGTEKRNQKKWLEERVKDSRSMLGMAESPADVNKLRTIHSQLRAEAKRIETRTFKAMQQDMGFTQLLQASPPTYSEHMEVGFITLYCECLMGVSLVSVKLAHTHYESYLASEPLSMEQDTYLFVSPSQLRKAAADVSGLPRMDIGNAGEHMPV